MERLLSTSDFLHQDWSPPLSWFQSRVYWREIGKRLPEHPEILKNSQEYVESVLQSGNHSCSKEYLQTWKGLLEQGMSSVLSVLLSPDDENSQVLRSCSPLPLMGLISDEERLRLYEQVKEEIQENNGVL